MFEKQDKKTIKDSYAEAESLYKNDKMQEAIDLLIKVVELNSNNPEEKKSIALAWDLLGQCYVAQSAEAESNKDFEEMKQKDTEADKCYEKALSLDSKCVSALHNRGLLYTKFALSYLEKNTRESKCFFQKACASLLRAQNITVIENPLFLHSMACWYEKYVELLKKTMMEQAQRDKTVISYYNQAIRGYRRAILNCKKEDEVLKKIIESNFVECLAQLGHFLWQKGDREQAVLFYLQAMTQDPEHFIVINQIGLYYYGKNNYEEAKRYFSYILKSTDPEEIQQAELSIRDCETRLNGQKEASNLPVKMDNLSISESMRHTVFGATVQPGLSQESPTNIANVSTF
jgi:tetratricopeptide (TPR) repeat protein